MIQVLRLQEHVCERVLVDRGAACAVSSVFASKVRGVPRVDDRRVISGIVHVLTSEDRWAATPASYGPKKTLYNRFVRWAEKGIWQDMFVALASARGPRLKY